MKTILITGSTDGIGKLAAKKLANDGHQIIVHGRNTEKLRTAISEIKELSNNENIAGVVSDLSDFESVRKMISELTSEYAKIDVLVNNAGVFKSKLQYNQDGLDLRFVVNYLSPYLLTKGVLPLLKKSDSARVINLSSAAQASISMEALKGSQGLSYQEAYAQSKLALTMWSFFLSEHYDFLNVIAVNPGSLLNTKMVQEAYGQFWSSADKGANILHDLAVLEKYSSSSGMYFDNDKGDFNRAHEDAYNPQRIAQLITETNNLLNF